VAAYLEFSIAQNAKYTFSDNVPKVHWLNVKIVWGRHPGNRFWLQIRFGGLNQTWL